MPAPRYVDAVRRQSSSQSREMSQRQGHGSRGNGRQAAAAKSASQKPTPLPHDPRFVYTFAAAMGRRVTIQVKSGVEFEGTLHGPVLGSKTIHVTLKNARKLCEETTSSDTPLQETLIIPANEFVQMKATGIPFSVPSNSQNGVQTNNAKEGSNTGSECTEEKPEYEVMPVADENDISGFTGDIHRAAVRGEQNQMDMGRPLVAWNGGDAEAEDIMLEGDAGGWCQFEAQANSAVHSTFNMSDYSTKLDVAQSRYTEEEAARIASEIESAPRDLPQVAVDDSGVFDEEVAPPSKEEIAVAPPKSKPFSWADAVKGKNTPQQMKPSVSESTRKMPEKKENESPRQAPAFQHSANHHFPPHVEHIPPHQMSSNSVYDNRLSYSEERDDAPKTFGYENSQAAFLAQPDSTLPMAFMRERGQDNLFGAAGYPLSNRLDPSTVGERPAGFSMTTEDASVDHPTTQFYGDPVWGPPSNEPLPVKTHVMESPPEQVDRGFRGPAEQEATVISPAEANAETKKIASTVVPGISFRDKLKANLPNAAPKISTPDRQRTPTGSAHAHTKSQSSFVDPTNDPVVQSPRQRTYSGKLITNPRTADLRPDASRGLPSEEHLFSPMTMANHPVLYAPPHEMVPGSMGVMPPMAPGGYPEMPPNGVPMPNGQYGNFGPPMAVAQGVHPEGMAIMPPPGHYVTHPHGSFSPVSDTAGREEGEVAATGRGRRRFQLNPMAKAFKPVVSLDGQPSAPEQYPPPYAAVAVPAEYETRPAQGGEVQTIVPTPPSGAVPQQQTPKQPTGPGERPPAEFSGNPLPPGARPPFVPPSNVVTPWPSFPGTGVWHSGLGTPRPGTPQANAMMNGFMPPGMPGPYPMFVPGMPPPYMRGMQDPMWRPPMPPGMPDQQSIAMMWGNYYSQIVPPNQRMWNPSKFPGPAGSMPRQGRNYRKPANGGNNPQPSPNFSAQSPSTQPSGEIS